MRVSFSSSVLVLTLSVFAVSCAQQPPAPLARVQGPLASPVNRVQDQGLAIAVDIVLARLRTAGDNEAQIKAAAPQIYDLAAALMPPSGGRRAAQNMPLQPSTSSATPSGAQLPQAHIIHASLPAGGAYEKSGQDVFIGAPRSLFYAIHLGSYRSAGRAFDGFDELRRSAPQILGALSPRVEKVDLGAKKGVYQRLKAGPFDNRAAANAACLVLRGQGLYCGVADFTGVAAKG